MADLPFGTATTAVNNTTETIYNVTLPAGADASINGQMFTFLVPNTALGATVRLNISGAGQRDVLFSTRRQLRFGWEVTFSANNAGVRWNFESQTPSDLSFVDTEKNASASAVAIAALTGAQIAKSGYLTPNEVTIANAPLTDSFQFKALLTASPTGTLYITNSDGARRPVVNASGVTIPAGTIVAPTIATFQYSAGFGNFVYVSSAAIPTLDEIKALASAGSPSIWKVLDVAITAPYGTVTKGADNKPVFTPKTINILGRGSSVSTAADDAQGQPGRNGGCPRDHVPLWLLRDGMKDKFGPGVNVVDWNFSHGGHVASQGSSQWDEARAAGMPIPDIMFDCFGMNDLSPYAYNSGQVSPNYFADPYYNEIKFRLDTGVKLVIIATTPHENTDAYTYDLNGVPMIWPYALAAPVTPDQMVPPATSATPNGGSVVNRDWTGRGIKRDGSARGQHVNALLRNMVRRLNADPVYRGRVILCDAGWAWFRYGLEQYTLAELYGPQEIVHPIGLGHAVSYDRCIREIVDAMQRGEGDKWWFRGDDAGA